VVIYLDHVVHSSNKVYNSEDIHSRDCYTRSTPGHVISLPSIVEAMSCTSHEVVKEVVDELDNIHDGFAALDDLPVDGSLDVSLDVINKIFFNVVLEILRHEKFFSSAPGYRILNDHGEEGRYMRHDSLQQSQRHCQE